MGLSERDTEQVLAAAGGSPLFLKALSAQARRVSLDRGSSDNLTTITGAAGMAGSSALFGSASPPSSPTTLEQLSVDVTDAVDYTSPEMQEGPGGHCSPCQSTHFDPSSLS